MALRESVLGLLESGPMTGYEIKKFYGDAIRHFWTVSDGQLYPTLKKMHEEGLIERKTVPQPHTANKHIYSITDKGREVFRQWLLEPVTTFEEMKEPFVIKMFFFDRLSKDDILAHIKAQFDVHTRVLEEFKEVRESYDQKITSYQRLIGDVGILYIELRLLWLSRLMQLVSEGQAEKAMRLYPEEMVELVKKFYIEVFSGKPSKEFRRWAAGDKKKEKKGIRGRTKKEQAAWEAGWTGK